MPTKKEVYEDWFHRPGESIVETAPTATDYVLIYDNNGSIKGSTVVNFFANPDGALTIGENDTGYDVTFFGDTAGKKFFFDASTDTTYLTCTVDVDGTITVGVDDTGYDVKFFGATSGAYLLWDESEDDLILAGASGLSMTGTGGISISGITTTGLSITDPTTGILLTYTASKTEGISMTVATSMTVGTGMSMSGAGTYTTGILLDATAMTTGISITAGSLTDGIKISGTTPVDGIEISSACSANAINLSGASAVGVALSGAYTSAAISVTATASRGLSIGVKGKSVDGSLPITAVLPFDTEPANNYLLGVFSKVAVTAVSATDDLGSAWIRTRINADMVTNAGYSLFGAKSQLRIYGGTTTTINNWAAAGLLGILEVSGASTTFASGSVTSAGFFNVSLTSDATIASGAVVSGIAVNSAGTGLTNTGTAYYGVYIKKAGSTAFDAGLKIDSSVCTTGIDIGSCTTGVSVVGTGGAVNTKAFTGRMTVNNANYTDGYGLIESELNLTGASSSAAGLSSWVNMAAGTYTGYICAQTNGVWEDGATISGATVIFGMRMQSLLAEAPAESYPFSCVSNTNIITALFSCNAGSSDMGTITDTAGETGMTVPLYKETSTGITYYVKIYTHS
jgi:hypothetical protein